MIEPEYVILVFCLFVIAWMLYHRKDKETFLDARLTEPSENVVGTSDEIDNSDLVDWYAAELEQDVSSPVPKQLDRARMTWDDMIVSQGINRTNREGRARAGVFKNQVDFSKRMFEEELREWERKEWWETDVPDTKFVDDDFPKMMTPKELVKRKQRMGQ